MINLLLLVNKSKSDESEYDLIHTLLKDYDSSIRPSLHHNYTLNVTFGLSLTQLIDIVKVYQKKFFWVLFKKG